MKTHEKLGNRIGKILDLLNAQGYVDIKELCVEFSVCEKTLRRDIQRIANPNITMSNGIILLQQERGKSDPQELAALNILKNIAKSLKGAIGEKALRLLEKLESKDFALGANGRDCIRLGSRDAIKQKAMLDSMRGDSKRGAGEVARVDSRNVFFTKTHFSDITLGLDSLKLLQECIQTHTLIGFGYTHKERVCLPLQIVAFEGEWYLFAQEYDLDTCDMLEKSPSTQRDTQWYKKHLKDYLIKKFYLNDIQDLRALPCVCAPDTKALERLDTAINAWHNPYGEKIFVRLWVDKAVAKYFKRKNSFAQNLHPHKDGSLEIELYITHYREISGEVLRWIPHIVVLEPEGLKEYIKENVREYVRRIEG